MTNPGGRAPEDATERPLEDREGRSLPIGGGCAVLAGGVIAGFAGLFALALAAVAVFGGTIPRDQRILIPPALLFVIIGGVGLMWTGGRDWKRAARAKEQAAIHTGEPWYADWAWDPAGVNADSFWGGGADRLVMLFIILVMAPFNILWLYVFDDKQETVNRLFSLMVLIPDFFTLALLSGIVKIVRRQIRLGRPRLQFDGFPFFLGRSLRARLTVQAFEGKEDVTATLRCIDERIVKTWTGIGSPTNRRRRAKAVGVFQLFAASRPFEGPFRGEEVPVVFALPESAPSTELLRKPPRYWELEVQSGVDSITFLVPVYAPPGGPS